MSLLSGWPSIVDDSGQGQDGTVLDLALFNALKASVEDQVHSTNNTTIKPKATTDEVVTARGSMGSLDARLDVSLNEDGTLKVAAGTLTDADLKTRGIGQKNLVLNGEFHEWDAAGTSPERWPSLGGATITRVGVGEADTTTVGAGRRAVKLTWTGGTGFLSQPLISSAFMSHYSHLKGKKIALVARVITSIASHASILVDDGVTTTQSAFHTGGGGTEVLSVVHTISPSATRLNVELQIHSAGSAYYGGVSAVISDVAPADSLALTYRFVTRKLYSKDVDAGNAAGGADTDLASFKLLKGTLDELTDDYDELEINAWGTTAANANSKTWKITLGATTLLNFSRTANNEHWWIRARILRDNTGANQRCIVQIAVGGNNGTNTYTLAAENLATDLDIKAIGASTGANDIVLKGFTVERV